jgi:hypothetical protein
MAGDIDHLGYQGNLGFWGTTTGGQPKSVWWDQDMSDAGQALYSDPSTAVVAGTVPKEVLDQQQEVKDYARKMRGGFLNSLKDMLGNVDSALGNVPSWTLKKLWFPVDKLASGAYWAYSNAVSQPLSTLLIQSSKAELAKGGFWGGGLNTLMSGDQWTDAYHEAEHVSPAQAFMNYENTANASGKDTAFGFTAGGAANTTPAEREAIKRNQDRFLYDTNYWRSKQGWTYTAGTGALDFMISMGADPTYAGATVVSRAVKGARSIKVAGQAEQPIRAVSGVNIAAQKLGNAIGGKFAKTAEEASRSKRVNGFFDWAEGKSAAEIAQHPIWGRGRRVNPAKDQISQVLSGAGRDDMPLMLRFAMGDSDAAVQLVGKNEDLATQLAKMEDNRVLVDSAKFQSDLFASYVSEARGGPALPLSEEARAVPFKQAEKVAEAAQAASKVRPLGPASQTTFADVMRAEEWKAGKLAEYDTHLTSLNQQQGYYSTALGSLATKVDDFSPGESNMFGTLKSLYRMGPLGIRDTEKAGTKAIGRLASGKDYLSVRDAGLATRVLRNGFYTAPIRVVQSFGEKTPHRFVNHNDDDAYMRVAEMLKQVPGLGADTRLDMIRKYSQAGDKVSRARALDEIHTDVVNHMAQGVHGLDHETARAIDDMRRVGFQKTMNALTGVKPQQQMYSAAVRDSSEGFNQGNRVDHVEDGEGYVISPLAKTQLQMVDPLLPVKELDRLLNRNSGFLKSVKLRGGNASDNVASVADSLNTVWKAATLLRPGYVLRSMSEEQVASAVKFGLMSTIIGGTRGGANWALNRGQQIKAVTGKGSYISALGSGKGYIRLTDEDAIAAAEAIGEKTERIKVNKAWPVIQSRITDERTSLAEAEKRIAKLEAKPNPQQSILDELDSLRLQAADHQQVIDEHVDYANAILHEAETSTGRRLGEQAREHMGVQYYEPFSKEWEHPIPRSQITSEHAMETVFARNEAIDNGRLIRTGDWKVIKPGDTTVEKRVHMDAWLHGLNRQFGQDDLFKLVAKDPTLKEASAWLKTPAGKYHLAQLGPRARDVDGTLDAVKMTLDQYLPEGTGLQSKVARGEEITEQDLRASVAEADFPPVHGEEFKALTKEYSKQTAQRVVDDKIARGFKLLATIPNDVMARQPIYLRAQEARMRELIEQELAYRSDVGLDDTVDVATLNKMLEKSDKLARKDISQIVYDPTRTTATEALRFVTPFLSAHVDGLQRWGGLVAERPQFLGAAAKVYNAPVAAGLVTDRYGRAVDQNGNVVVVDENGKKSSQFVPMEQRVLTLRMPGDTQNIQGIGKVAAGGHRINVSALNTILPGDPWFNPGTGPFTQVAMSNLAKKSPQIGDFLQWSKILPYGPSEGLGIKDAFTPAYMKDAWAAFDAYALGGTNQSYQDNVLSEYQRQMADYHNGGPAPDWKKVQENAKSFTFFEALTNWISPARVKDTPLSKSPYQFFMDQYKVMQDIDPQNAKANFFQKYGADLFAMTASLSKSVGVQATIPAQYTAERYGNFIAQDPDMAPLIVGDVYNQGQFSSSVYRKQMDELLNGVRLREKISPIDAIKQNQKDLGWQQYNKYAGMIDAEMIRSGFHSYNQKGAQPLSDLKTKLVDAMSQMYPDWYHDYGTTNRVAIPERINVMKQLVSDEKIMSDPLRAQDLGPLSAYIQQREVLKQQLAERGAKSLSFGLDGTPTGKNSDIGMQLRTLQLYLVNNSLGFSDIFHRYLESDDLS